VMRAGVRGTYRTLETSHRDGTRDAPTEGDLYGNGVPIVVVGVTTHQGGWESHPQGEGAQVVRRSKPCGTRNAESRCGFELHLSPYSDRSDHWRAK
jgi:hypothetical protein